MNYLRKYMVVGPVVMSVVVGAAPGQDGRPSPQPPTEATQTPDADVEDAPPARTADGRRPDSGDKVVLAFDGVSIEDTIPFIVQSLPLMAIGS